LLSSLATLVPELQSAHRVAVVTDDVVGPLYAARIAAQLGEDRSLLISIPPGEEHKTRLSWARITDALLDAQLGRDSLLIALGGGVVGDLTGFVAATYLRGIPFVQLPTTVLAMVDASIGGKTGVDTTHGKNLVGAFHPPVAVVADLDTIGTLPLLERVNGLAEALKHGVICDAEYFAQVAATDLTAPDWQQIITRSVEIKAGVVAADEREQGCAKCSTSATPLAMPSSSSWNTPYHTAPVWHSACWPRPAWRSRSACAMRRWKGNCGERWSILACR
jgi:3-dehydroquinate synthase